MSSMSAITIENVGLPTIIKFSAQMVLHISAELNK